MGPSGAYAPDPAADWHLLAGDESALPAIGAALEALPANAIGKAFIEVAGPEDEIPLTAPEGVEVSWVYRGGRADLVGEDRAGDFAPLIEAVSRPVASRAGARLHPRRSAGRHAQPAAVHPQRARRGRQVGVVSPVTGGAVAPKRRSGSGRRELASRGGGRGLHQHRLAFYLMAFGDYQNEIYLQGLAGMVPSLPMVFAELEAKAEKALPPSVWSYVAGGAGDERTQRANCEAFERWGLIPRMFVGAAERDLSVELFGLKLPSPVFMAPIGVIGLCAQDGHGDLATARAAARTGVPMVASTLTVDPMEDVAADLGDTPGSSSSTHRPTASWPPALCIAPRRPASRASSSPSTPG